jgi:hypothetical protein
MDEFLGAPARRHGLINDFRGKRARAWMDKIHPHLSPPISRPSRTFWEDYGEKMAGSLPHKSSKQREYYLELMLEFYPNGPRYA